jgi:hypothetical protein
MCLKNQIKRKTKSSPSIPVNNHDVPNRTSATVTPESTPLIQESLKESPSASKAQGVLQPLLMWEKNPGKTTNKRSWPEQNLCVLPHRSSTA